MYTSTTPLCLQHMLRGDIYLDYRVRYPRNYSSLTTSPHTRKVWTCRLSRENLRKEESHRLNSYSFNELLFENFFCSITNCVITGSDVWEGMTVLLHGIASA